MDRHDKIAISMIFLLSLLLAIISSIWQASTMPNIPRESFDIDPRTALELARGFARNYSDGVVPPGVDIYITGIQWAWIPNNIKIKAGVTYRFIFMSSDVVHGLEIIGPKGVVYSLMVMPGMAYVAYLRFDEPGVYEIRCNEYCGIGHQDMIGRIEVVR
ncbi:MAG: hypothetical protein QXQ57_00535 [Sulfolobales archaeon]